MDRRRVTSRALIAVLTLWMGSLASYGICATLPWTMMSDHQLNTAKGCFSQPRLVCHIQGTTGNGKVTGMVMFSPSFWAKRPGQKCGVLIRAIVQGLRPGFHGFHIHTYGDIRRNDAFLAGGHFTNPAGSFVPHGLPDDDARRHWGDFGNLRAWNRGNAGYTRTDFVIRLGGIIGRSIVIHAEEDKGASEQPSGASGSRIAQCVIGIANPAGTKI